MSNINESLIYHLDELDGEAYNIIKSMINNNMEDSISNVSINLYTSKDKISNKTEKPKKKRCMVCNKKLGLLGFDCKCGHLFCSKHRMPEDHECTIDYKETGKKILERDNIKVVKDKIDNRL